MSKFEAIKGQLGKGATIKLLDELLGRGYSFAKADYSPHFDPKQIAEASEEIHQLFMKAKQFSLSVEQAQNIYSPAYLTGTTDRLIHVSSYDEFELPFPETLFAFDRPLEVCWAIKESSSAPSVFKAHELIGFLVRERALSEVYQDRPHNQNLAAWWEHAKPYTRAYRAYLLFIEDDPSYPADAIVSHQYIDFSTYKNIPDGGEYLLVFHTNHLCSDKAKCEITKAGRTSTGNPHDLTYCQEYANRKGIVETLIYLANAVNEKEVIEKRHEKKTIWDYIGIPFNGVLPSPNTAAPSPMPKPGYSSYLNDKRYEYADEVNHGTGTKHRFRYDVRKHPRIVNGHLIWVSPHQRGKGDYIPKVYTRTKLLSVPYFVERVETLSKFPPFEKLFIMFIRLWRRWKKR